MQLSPPPPPEGTSVTAQLPGPRTSEPHEEPIALENPRPPPSRLPYIIGGAALVVMLGAGAMLMVKSNSDTVAPLPVAQLDPEPKLESPPKIEKQPETAAVETVVPDAGAQLAQVVPVAPIAEPVNEPPPKKGEKKKTGKGGRNEVVVKQVIAKDEKTPSTIVASLKKESQTDVRPTATASASFEVVSEPAGQVRVNGRFVGASGNARVTNIPPGEVKVEVYDSRTGFSKTQTFNVSAGENGVKKIVVEKGMLEIRIRPYATVFLDGKPLGDTPIPPQSVYEGKHELKLLNRDLKYEKTFDIVVKPGQTTPFKKNLEEGD